RSRRKSRQPEWLLIKHKDEYAASTEADDLLADVAPPPGRKPPTGKKAKPARAPSVRSARARSDNAGAKARRAAKLAAQVPGARRAELADTPFSPQLASLGSKPPEGDAWVHELKWDGYRLIAIVRDNQARLWSRNAIEWTEKLPEIIAALQSLSL